MVSALMPWIVSSRRSASSAVSDRGAVLDACRGADLGARLGVLADVGAREPGVQQAAVRGMPREADGVGGRRHAGPAPFLNGMPVWKSVARARSPSCGRSDESGTMLTPSGVSPVPGTPSTSTRCPSGSRRKSCDGAVGQAIGLAAVGRALERAERLGAPAGLGEVVHGDREVVQRRHGGVALEEVQLAVAEAQPDGREADVGHGQPLAAEQLLVEARRALEVARRERDVVEADTHAARSYQIGAPREQRCERARERLGVRRRVRGRGGDAQALGSARHRRVVDRLHVDRVLGEQAAAATSRQRSAPGTSTGTMWLSLGMASTPARANAPRSAATLRASAARSAPDARRWRTLGERGRGDGRRQRGREDEAAGVAAHAVDHAGRAGDEPAERPVALGEAALDDRHGAGGAERLRDAGALAAVGARRRASRRGRSARRARRRARRSRAAARCRRPWSRSTRTRRCAAARAAAPRAARAGARDRCAGRSRARRARRGCRRSSRRGCARPRG